MYIYIYIYTEIINKHTNSQLCSFV